MLRALLASRFRLVASRETRELPSYALVRARSDVASDRDRRLTRRVRARLTNWNNSCIGGLTALRWVSIYTARAREWSPLTMDEIARFIMLNAVDRPVSNRTELSGYFDIDLDFTRVLSNPEPQASAGDRQPVAVTGTSIFTAVQEQLGLNSSLPGVSSCRRYQRSDAART